MRVAVAVAATDLTPHAVSAPFARERSSELSLLDRFVEVMCVRLLPPCSLLPSVFLCSKVYYTVHRGT